MHEIRNCPFCLQPTETSSENGGNHYLFKCSNCGTFFMYDSVYRRMGKGEYATRKAALLEFIKNTPADNIAYIGHRIPAEGQDGLYCGYRPL
jgi:transposase-like protein